jgi:hypothetical protein
MGPNVAVFADEVLCAEVDLRQTDAAVVVGGVGQLAVCNRPGAELTFVTSGVFRRFFTLTFNPAASDVFRGYQPIPPGSRYPAYVCRYIQSRGFTLEPTGACSSPAPPKTGSGALENEPPQALQLIALGILAAWLTLLPRMIRR